MAPPSHRHGFIRVLLFLGPLTAVAAWLVILASWWLNRGWFTYTRHAFSDLGGSRSCCPGLYNYGLMVLGALFSLYGIGVTIRTRTKLGVVGGGYIVIAGIFLALIGLFPTGTRHHVCVSTWFFIQSYLGLILVLAETTRHSNAAKYALIVMLASIPTGIAIAVWPEWPSAAVLETYLILFIDLAVIAATVSLLKEAHSALRQ